MFSTKKSNKKIFHLGKIRHIRHHLGTLIKIGLSLHETNLFFLRSLRKFNSDELDEPQLVKKRRENDDGVSPTKKASSVVDIERQDAADGVAVIALGNPLEEGATIFFDLSFKLVRSSSERVSASLIFEASVNSSSTEDNPTDNNWRAELQLIKEADLQLVCSHSFSLYNINCFAN